MNNIKSVIFKRNLVKIEKSFLKEYYKTFLIVILFIVFGDIIFLNTSSDLVTFGILILYVLLTKTVHIKSRFTFLLCLVLLCVMFINFLFSGTSIATEKASVWLVLFMIVGIIQQWTEK